MSTASLTCGNFAERLAETIAWCAPRARHEDPRSSLRSEQLRPSDLVPGATSVAEVVSKRAVELRAHRVSVEPVVDVRGGRLVVLFPEESLSDGAAEVLSDGLFDDENVPPWDTWITAGTELNDDGRSGPFVIAWIPPRLVELAAAGIEANPESCLWWLENMGIREHAELRPFCRPEFFRPRP